MNFIFNQTWVLFILVTFANAFILKYRSKEYIRKDPTLQSGYDLYFRGFILYGNIPWAIMAIGNLSGMTHSTFDYLAPRNMNPAVLVMHASIILLWLIAARWIYFKGGAEFIERHPGLFNKPALSGKDVTAKQIKLFFPLMILGGIAGMVMMWLSKFPVVH